MRAKSVSHIEKCTLKIACSMFTFIYNYSVWHSLQLVYFISRYSTVRKQYTHYGKLTLIQCHISIGEFEMKVCSRSALYSTEYSVYFPKFCSVLCPGGWNEQRI